jgi:uncharacterized protein
MRPGVVFDTNVLFSAIGWKGNPYRCLELARTGAVEGVTWAEIVAEFSEKLRLKLGFSDEQVSETLADLLGVLRVVTITGQLKVVEADPEDDKVLECAVVAAATHIITGDRRHLLPLKSHAGISIVSPSGSCNGKPRQPRRSQRKRTDQAPEHRAVARKNDGKLSSREREETRKPC